MPVLDPSPTARPPAESVTDVRVLMLILAASAYFVSAGVGFPVLPRLVERELGGGSGELGLVFGIQSLGMLAARPFAGYLGDRIGRRPLMVAGAIVIAGAQLLQLPAARSGGLGLLLALRFVFGMAGSAMYLAHATVATEIGSAASRAAIFAAFSTSVYLGFALGPVLGETMLDAGGFGAAFGSAAVCAGVSAVAGFLLPETRPPDTVARLEGLGSIVHPAVFRIGVINFLLGVSFVSFGAFVTPYAEDLGLDETKWILFTFAATVLVIRAIGGRYLDGDHRLAIATGSAACVMSATALLAAVAEPSVLYLGGFLLAFGIALTVPLMVLIAADSAAPEERSRVVATVVVFGDIANTTGALVLGGVAELAGYRVMYGTVAAMAALALTLIRSPWFRPAGLVVR